MSEAIDTVISMVKYIYKSMTNLIVGFNFCDHPWPGSN